MDRYSIAEYKRAELESLGINPNFFNTVCNYLNDVYDILFKKGDGNPFLLNKRLNEFTTFSEALVDITEVFSISHDNGFIILNEWRRSQIIYIKMGDNLSKYLKYRMIPLLLKK